MKKKTKTKRAFKLPQVKNPSEIQGYLYNLIKTDPEQAGDQMMIYWMALTACHLEWGGETAAKTLKGYLTGMTKGIVGGGK